MPTLISLDLADSFKYQPLDSSAQEIRLLWVRQASSPYDLIECSLHITKLDKKTKYVVCESGEIDQPLDFAIFCDDQLCQVSKDVYSRLLRLREWGWQWIWVENICVNQRNTRERAEQIVITPAIYDQAVQCFRLASPRQYELSVLTRSDQIRPTEPLPTDRQQEFSTLTRSDQIRLMELLPASTTKAPLRCQFYVVALDNSPRFTLIDVNFPVPKEVDQSGAFLYCNDHALPIQPVLSLALRALLSSGHTIFWINSVCVNGDDPADQKHHAALEEMILQKAHDKIRVQRQMFHYSKLDSAKNQIRLLRIHPVSSANSTLVIEPITASLDEKPDYIALSYVWGSNSRDYDVLCVGGSTIPITKNLYLTLCELRQNSFRVVWADQICINQHDRQELGQQVSMMSRIYRQARSVVVNLAPTLCQNPNPHRCQLSPAPPKQPDWLILMRILSLTRRVLLAVRPDRPSFKLSEFERFGVPPLHHKVWRSWRAVRANPWFTRGWIIQEVAANADVWVLCSRRLVKWEELAAANRVIEGEVAGYGSIGGQKLFHDLDHLKKSTENSPYSLLDLVTAFRDIQTSDARDKVHAFRGLAADADIAPCPDYTQPASRIYHEFARYCVNQGQGMNLICEAGLNRLSMDSPSWVADWSFENISSLYNFTRGRNGSMLGCLNNVYQHRKTMSSSDVALTSDPSVISAMGLIWDKISGVSEGFKSQGTIHNKLENFSVLDTTALALLVSLERDMSIYEEELMTVLARTLFIKSEDCVKFYQEVKTQAHEFQEEIGSDALGLGYMTYLGGRLAHLNMRRFAVTEKGYMGLVPTLAEKGDRIAAFKGCRAPFVLRKKENMYVLIGDAHFDGLERVCLDETEMEKVLLR